MTTFNRCKAVIERFSYTDPRILSRKLFCFRRVWYISACNPAGYRIRLATATKKKDLLPQVVDYFLGD